MESLEYLSHSVAETQAYAEQIARVLQPGDVVILEGNLGAGKTQFVSLCCQALGYSDAVTSPTFTLANLYNLGDYHVVHADFYRVNNELELLDTGLDNYFDNSITLIEWGEKFQGFFDGFLKIKMEYVEDCPTCRKLTLTCQGGNWPDKLNTISKSLDSKH